MNRTHNGRQGQDGRDNPAARQRDQDERRYFPQDDNHNRRYQSGGYPEEVGNYGNPEEIQGPNRQGRDWQAEQARDFRDNRQDGSRGGGQSFRGHGPKGYQRSDERLKEMICEKLLDDDAIDAREISVDVKDGEVTLSGTVTDRRIRFQAEELVERCGIQEIHNQLRVNRGDNNAGDTSRPGARGKGNGGSPGGQR